MRHVFVFATDASCICLNRCVMSMSMRNALVFAVDKGVTSNNGIGGFHKNLATFRGPKLPDFLLAQKLRLKKCSSWVQLKSWQIWSCGAKTQKGGKLRRIDRHRPKIFLNPNFLGYFNRP